VALGDPAIPVGRASVATSRGRSGPTAEGDEVNRLRTSLGALVALVALAAACAQPSEQDLLAGGDGPGPVPTSDPGGEVAEGPNVADDPDAIAEAAVQDVTDYWRATYPEIYGDEFEEVAGFYPYGPDTEPPPCGDPPPEYELIADNAFYCPSDDIIAWDAASFLPEINETFGGFTVAIVIAHEYGHAIQARADAFDRTVDLELQADCFAGAWTGRVTAGAAGGFSPDDVDLNQTVAGMTAIRDIPGTDPDDPLAHGSGFDRVTSFQDGYENGAQACVAYADESVDRDTTEVPFSPEEFETEGNLHLEDRGPEDPGLLSLLVADLNEFYGVLFGEIGQQWTPVDELVLVDPASESITCGGQPFEGRDLEGAAVYCEDENVVVLDGAGLVPDLNRIGDFAVGAEVGRLWAQAAQARLGVAGAAEAALQADCLTGVWSITLSPDDETTPESQLTTSAGDLDEAIRGFLAYGSALDEEVGTIFERTSALRTGYREGYTGCEREYGALG
jgi:predicted metalloprotease